MEKVALSSDSGPTGARTAALTDPAAGHTRAARDRGRIFRAMSPLIVATALILTAAACGGDTPMNQQTSGDRQEKPRAGSSSPDGSSAGVVVTRDDTSLPDGCGPRQTAGLISNFFRAFNEGKVPELHEIFAAANTSPPLYGVGTGGDRRGTFGTGRREELLHYFADRHRHGERLRLLHASVDPSSRGNAVDVTYLATRSAEDLQPVLAGSLSLDSYGFLYVGKGVIDCESRKILAWNMDIADETGQGNGASTTRPEKIGPCPTPDGWKPGDTIVACTP